MVEPLSVVAAVEACYTLAKELYKYIDRMRRFGQEVRDISWRFEDHNTVLRRFIEFFKKEEKWINENDRRYLKGLFEKLSEDLHNTELQIQKDLQGNIKERMTWPIIGKYLEYAEQELARWVQALNIKFTMLPADVKQSMIDMVTSEDYKMYKKPLSGLIASVEMLQAKQKHIADADLVKLKKPENEAIDTGASGGPISIFGKDIIPKVYDEQEMEVAKLVYMLRKADSSQIHIPMAEYYFVRNNGDLGIVYQWPEDVKGREKQPTMKELIRRKPVRLCEHHPKHRCAAVPEISLHDRLRVAREIVIAVAYLHAVGWVHKTLKSDNIILARHHSDPPTGLGHVNLVGFNYARRQEKRSTGSPYFDWKEEIYRHPNRQRLPKPQEGSGSETTTLNEGETADRASNETGQPQELEYFRPKHDVYSLGVVLLELGLWQDLEEFESELHQAKAEDRETALTDKSKWKLPGLVGERYQQVVKRCLQVDKTDISAQEVLRELEEIRV